MIGELCLIHYSISPQSNAKFSPLNLRVVKLLLFSVLCVLFGELFSQFDKF